MLYTPFHAFSHLHYNPKYCVYLVTAIVQRMYARRSQYQSKFRDLKDFLKLHQIPKDLKQRVEDYFQTMWALNHGIDPHEVKA